MEMIPTITVINKFFEIIAANKLGSEAQKLDQLILGSDPSF